MDLHRRRSVLVRMAPERERLGKTRISNSPAALRAEIAKAGVRPKVVLEATYGWYWAADTLAPAGAEVHSPVRAGARPRLVAPRAGRGGTAAGSPGHL
jgi:hypothetical protein